MMHPLRLAPPMRCQGLRNCGNRTLAFPRFARAYIFFISTIRNKSRRALRYNPVSQIQVVPQ
jgi:hypothetical protein